MGAGVPAKTPLPMNRIAGKPARTRNTGKESGVRLFVICLDNRSRGIDTRRV